MIEQKSLTQNDIDFLMSVSKALMVEDEPMGIVSVLNKIFKNYFPIKHVNFYLWDETYGRLRDFQKDWVAPTAAQDDEKERIFKTFHKDKKHRFYFNSELVDFKLKLQDYDKVCASLSEEENVIYFPLITRSGAFGVIELLFNKLDETIVFNTNFLDVLNIALMQVSSVILNHILKDQMEISLNFYAAMKDIAKIIESQYELAYIIPLIGEMIDRFISAHLIYIFVKNKEGRYELLWPNACKDREVTALLERINLRTEYIISENHKIGVFPLISENTILGAIVAYSNVDKLIQKEIEYLVQLSKQSSVTLQRANVYAEVLKHATLDALTGLNNRRQFEMRLNQEIATSRRKHNPLCCMMLDVDYFKKVNDTYGHAAGDCVLKAVSGLISREIREYDIASRYGGEEFFVILPQTTLEEASFVAQRLRRAIEEAQMDITEAKVPNTDFLNITVSIGVSDFDGKESPEEFYHNADKALYEAKNRGRNKVVVFNRQDDTQG
ncbi:MAG: GGDEF domain-containing protein [Candidatus Gastranaerophilales bacterium]|nr:GGDEF domain-containing protein [Candidatus Gastranaerophilales bacterium]